MCLLMVIENLVVNTLIFLRSDEKVVILYFHTFNQCIYNSSVLKIAVQDHLFLYQKKLGNKKAVINPKNEDDFCFAYAVIVALNHKEIDHHPERISNLKKLISSYNWKRISMPVQKRLGTI